MNIESARHAAEFVRICSHDKLGRVAIGMCPGHDCKIYQVNLSRDIETSTIHASCLNVDEGAKCKGNAHGVCYHALAVIISAATRFKGKIALCESEQGAKSRAALGGQVIKIISIDSPERMSVFAVFEKEENNQTP